MFHAIDTQQLTSRSVTSVIGTLNLEPVRFASASPFCGIIMVLRITVAPQHKKTFSQPGNAF